MNPSEKELIILHHKLFELSPIPMAITSTDGLIIDFNSAFCELTGYTHSYLIGKKTIDLNIWSKKDREEILEITELTGKILNYRVTITSRMNIEKEIIFSIQRVDIDGRYFYVSTAQRI